MQITRMEKEFVKTLSKNLEEYHDLYYQSNTLLLPDVFENFQNIYLEIYELYIAYFPSAPGLAWPVVLKKTKGKLDLLTDIDMLLMLEKGGICHSIYRYAKANNKYMKDYDKNKESSYLQYWDVNNLYGWAMPQKLPENDFKWVEDIHEFNEYFIKSYNGESDGGYFLKVDVLNILKIYITFTNIYFFCPKE